MTLPSSGQLAISQINTELGLASNAANSSLDGRENGTLNSMASPKPSPTNPASISEWYSYNHKAVQVRIHQQAAVGVNVNKIYYKIDAGSWILLASTTIPVTPSYTALPIITFTGTTLYLAVRNNVDANIQFGSGNGGAFSGFCGQATPYSVTPSVTNNEFFLNTGVSGGAYITC